MQIRLCAKYLIINVTVCHAVLYAMIYSAKKNTEGHRGEIPGDFCFARKEDAAMPTQPKRPCRYPGCPSLATPGEQYCPQHKTKTEQFYNKYQRPNDKNAYGRAWKRIRDRKIKENPLCEECLKNGIYKAAEEVHHILPLADGGRSTQDNLMSLCRSCHLKMHGETGTRKAHSFDK